MEEDISHAAFPFMTWKSVQLSCGVTARALRVTFVGELGFELHVGCEQMDLVYRSLWTAAQARPELGVRNAGYRALETLRLEKGYRVWGSDLSPQTSPLEAGLGFCCRWDKAGGFIGMEALQRVKAAGGPSRKLACFTVEEGPAGTALALSNESLGFTSPDLSIDQALGIRPQDCLLLYGNEAISFQGRVVGYSTSAGFGYSLAKHVVYAFLPTELADLKDIPPDAFKLNAYGTQVSITKQPNNKALYDHKREKILC